MHQSNLFESLNFRYFGPVDGHDVLHLVELLEDMKNIPRAQVVASAYHEGEGISTGRTEPDRLSCPGKVRPETGALVDLAAEPDPNHPFIRMCLDYTLLELARNK